MEAVHLPVEEAHHIAVALRDIPEVHLPEVHLPVDQDLHLQVHQAAGGNPGEFIKKLYNNQL